MGIKYFSMQWDTSRLISCTCAYIYLIWMHFHLLLNNTLISPKDKKIISGSNLSSVQEFAHQYFVEKNVALLNWRMAKINKTILSLLKY